MKPTQSLIKFEIIEQNMRIFLLAHLKQNSTAPRGMDVFLKKGERVLFACQGGKLHESLNQTVEKCIS